MPSESALPEVVLVLTTAPDNDAAESWAATLVGERLAACVNVLPPMVSFYRWKGEVNRDAERQMIIKTTRARVAELRKRLIEIHSYELPEFIMLSIEHGSEEYLRWVGEQTGAGG